MGPEESDHHHAVCILHQANQTKIVCLDIEDYPAALKNARLGMCFLHREPNRDSADILRSLVTLSYGLRATGLSPTAFGKKYVDRRLDDGSALVRKWASGKTAAGRRSIARLEPAVPGILALYSHPVFDLLRDRQIGRRGIASLLSRYRNPSGQFPPWWFGDEYERFPELRFIPIVLREDTSALWQRGDMDGFTVILFGRRKYFLIQL